jgi:TMEM199 family protein
LSSGIIHLAYFATVKMVLLTMTPSIVEGLHALDRAVHDRQPTTRPHRDDAPSLEDPAVGNPVSHSQVVDMWKDLRDARHGEYTLEMLLKGANVYLPPPAPKPEPVS